MTFDFVLELPIFAWPIHKYKAIRKCCKIVGLV